MYLLEERGLTQATVVNNAGFINQFLSARFRKGQLSLSQLHAPDVTIPAVVPRAAKLGATSAPSEPSHATWPPLDASLLLGWD
jgi:hypothetical protein